MRTSLASLLGIVLFFVGLIAVSESAQQSKDNVQDGTAGSDAYNMSVGVFEGVSKGGGEAIVWFGVAAVICVALGYLVVAGQGGGR